MQQCPTSFVFISQSVTILQILPGDNSGSHNSTLQNNKQTNVSINNEDSCQATLSGSDIDDGSETQGKMIQITNTIWNCMPATWKTPEDKRSSQYNTLSHFIFISQSVTMHWTFPGDNDDCSAKLCHRNEQSSVSDVNTLQNNEQTRVSDDVNTLQNDEVTRVSDDVNNKVPTSRSTPGERQLK